MFKFNHFFTLFASYLFLLLWNGYTFGHGDLIEVLPYALWMADQSLYPHDLYIQNTITQVPNERYILAKVFSWFGNAQDWIALIFHFLCSIFLLEGLFQIAKKYIKTEGLIWAAILIPISILYGKNLGGNEMYIPLFTSSTLAKALGIWAIYYFLKKDQKYFQIYLLLILAAIIQPIVSVQLFVLITGVSIVENLFNLSKSKNWRNLFIGIVGYLLTAGVWIFFLNRNFSAGVIDNQLLFDFFEFRDSHHYFPSYFPLKYFMFLVPIFLIGLYYFFKIEIKLFLFFGLALLGLIVFWLGVEVFQISSILSAQWFKTTIWLKAFSFIAIFALLENSFSFLRKNWLDQLITWGIRIGGVIAIVVMMHPFFIFKNRPYDLPFFTLNNADLEISKIAKSVTNKDAVFLIPKDNTHFKYYSQRNSYVDYKAIVHRKSFIPTWYSRIKKVYGIDVSNRRGSADVNELANSFYKNISVEKLNQFSDNGVTHLLTFSNVNLPFEKIGSNEKFVIYKLP